MYRTKPIFTLTTIAIAIYSLVACGRQSVDIVPYKIKFLPGEVGFYVEKNATKTEVSENGTSLEWVNGDKAYLWAINAGTSDLVLNQREFTAFAGSGLDRAYFTTVMDTPMASGNYLYAACYPAPTSTDGTSIKFTLPGSQNGRVGSVDFMVSNVEQNTALTPIKEIEDYTGLRLQFNHKFHLFRFYIPEGHEGAEKGLSTFEVRTDADINGSYHTDIYDQANEGYTKSSTDPHTIDMVLSNILYPSRDGKRQYAYMAVLPFQSGSDDKLEFSTDPINNKTEIGAVALKGRKFEAGHVTAVAIRPVITDVRDFTIKLTDNKCGEPVRIIRLTGPEGLTWDETGNNVVELSDGDAIVPSDSFVRRYKLSSELYGSINSEILIEIISDHIKFTDSITIDQSNKDNFHLSKSVAAPYLLYEDFASVASFSSNDAYATLSTGDKSAYSFLNGWTGGRIGANAGNCVRLAARRETSARYHARMDSAPLSGEIIAPVELEISFDYGTNNRYGGIGSGNYGQNVFIGYTKESTAFSSGTTTGNFSDGITFNTNDKNTDWTTPNHAVYTMSMDEGTLHRICWRTEVENHAGANNTTCWLYLDNIVVKVK